MLNDINADGKKLTIQPGKKHLILCEGNDDECFLSCFIKSGVLPEDLVDTVQVTQAHGVDNLRKMVLALINADGFSQLRSLLIIRDADDNIQSAKDSVKGAFSTANLPVPQAEYMWEDNSKIKTAFLLMPACSNISQNGSLDDLCWEILSEKHGKLIRNEVDGFISSLEVDGKRTYVHRKKALVRTYFSSTEGLITSSIGRAAEAGAFDWTSEKLYPLREFLKSIF